MPPPGDEIWRIQTLGRPDPSFDFDLIPVWHFSNSVSKSTQIPCKICFNLHDWRQPRDHIFPFIKLFMLTSWGFPGGSDSKESTCNSGDLGSIPGSGRSPGEGKATHSSILVWRIPQREESGRLQSMWSQNVGHDWVTKSFTFLLTHVNVQGLDNEIEPVIEYWRTWCYTMLLVIPHMHKMLLYMPLLMLYPLPGIPKSPSSWHTQT